MISNSGGKILSFYQEAKKLSNGEMIIPRFVSIWLSTICNLRCPYCYFSEINKKGNLIDTNSIKKVLVQLSDCGVESVEFSGGGEPTLHQDCYNLAEFANSLGLKVGMLTNGYKLDSVKFKYFDYIRVGLDATDLNEYKLMKGKEEGFNLAISFAEKVLKKRKGNRPRIGFKFMISSKNYLNVSEMIWLSSFIGVDYCHFKGMHSYRDELSMEQMNKVERVLELYREKTPNYVYGSVKKIKPFYKCFMSPIHAVINSNCELLICCYFTSKQYIIGNMNKEKFKLIWFGNKHKKIIKKIRIEDCAKVDCRWHYYNTEMKEILEKGKYDLSFI